MQKLSEVKTSDGKEGLMLDVCECPDYHRTVCSMCKQSSHCVDTEIDRDNMAKFLKGFIVCHVPRIILSEEDSLELADALIRSKDTWVKIVYVKE